MCETPLYVYYVVEHHVEKVTELEFDSIDEARTYCAYHSVRPGTLVLVGGRTHKVFVESTEKWRLARERSCPPARYISRSIR